jgi:hypothetical protein
MRFETGEHPRQVLAGSSKRETSRIEHAPRGPRSSSALIAHFQRRGHNVRAFVIPIKSPVLRKRRRCQCHRLKAAALKWSRWQPPVSRNRSKSSLLNRRLLQQNLPEARKDLIGKERIRLG